MALWLISSSPSLLSARPCLIVPLTLKILQNSVSFSCLVCLLARSPYLVSTPSYHHRLREQNGGTHIRILWLHCWAVAGSRDLAVIFVWVSPEDTAESLTWSSEWGVLCTLSHYGVWMIWGKRCRWVEQTHQHLVGTQMWLQPPEVQTESQWDRCSHLQILLIRMIPANTQKQTLCVCVCLCVLESLIPFLLSTAKDTFTAWRNFLLRGGGATNRKWKQWSWWVVLCFCFCFCSRVWNQVSMKTRTRCRVKSSAPERDNAYLAWMPPKFSTHNRDS